jgi:hypothetical protein
MNRTLTSALLFSLICLVGLGIFVMSPQAIAVAQTSTPPPPEINSCIRDPETGNCMSFPLGYANAYLKPAGTGNGNITARIDFFDFGSALLVTGTADGLAPDKVYVSLIYDKDSVATGPTACLNTNNGLTFPGQMVVGVWLPLGSKTRTLHAIKAGTTGQITDYAPLSAIGTVSIREETALGQQLPPRPDPVRFQLRACARVDSTALIQ